MATVADITVRHSTGVHQAVVNPAVTSFMRSRLLIRTLLADTFLERITAQYAALGLQNPWLIVRHRCWRE